MKFITGRLETPNLYDVKLKLTQSGEEVDAVSSYFGMRKISVENGMVLLNNRPYIQKLILDQGYWPQSFTYPLLVMTLYDLILK